MLRPRRPRNHEIHIRRAVMRARRRERCGCSGRTARGKRSLATTRRAHPHHPRQLGHRPCLREVRCGCSVRHDLRAGRGRLQSDRAQLSQRTGLVGAGGRRVCSVQRLARAFVHRCRPFAAAIPRCARVAEVAHGRMVGGPQLLPLEASRCTAEGHPSFRAVDGAIVHRGQHRRRHREHRFGCAGKILRAVHAGAAGLCAPGASRAGGVSRRLQWLRDRPGAQRVRTRHAVDQSAYLLLFSLGAADGERAGSERVRSGDLGPVLRLSGFQRPQRLDAHLVWRRRHR
jgi:hypothetical protein